MSLAEALMALALLCVFIVPVLSLARQSTVNYSHAMADYQTDLALENLLAHTRDLLKTQAASDVSFAFSDYAMNGRYEFEIIIEEFMSKGPAVKLRSSPGYGGLDIEPAKMSPTGDFAGLITAAAKDSRTGILKIKALPY